MWTSVACRDAARTDSVPHMRMRTIMVPLVVAGAVAVARCRARASPDPSAEAAVTRAGAPTRPRQGGPGDRGAGGTVRMDLARARAAHVEPVVEFLTYVQQRRGDREHLLFVRSDDLDAMAAASDEPVDDFLARLDQLGVVVSHN